MYEALISHLRECAKYYNVENTFKEAADAIENLDDICQHQADELRELKNQWIPVTDRLPIKDGTYITAYSKGGVSQNWYMTFHNGGGKWYQNSEDTGEVTHWMPLPKPPKEE